MQPKSFIPFVRLAFWSVMLSPAVLAHDTDAADAKIRHCYEFGSSMQLPLVTTPSWWQKYCSMPDCNQASGGICDVRTGQQATHGCQQFGIPGGVVSLLFSSNISGLRVRLFTGAGCTGNARDFWPVNPIDCQNFHDGLPWGAESFLVF